MQSCSCYVAMGTTAPRFHRDTLGYIPIYHDVLRYTRNIPKLLSILYIYITIDAHIHCICIYCWHITGMAPCRYTAKEVSVRAQVDSIFRLLDGTVVSGLVVAEAEMRGRWCSEVRPIHWPKNRLTNPMWNFEMSRRILKDTTLNRMTPSILRDPVVAKSLSECACSIHGAWPCLLGSGVLWVRITADWVILSIKHTRAGSSRGDLPNSVNITYRHIYISL